MTSIENRLGEDDSAVKNKMRENKEEAKGLLRLIASAEYNTKYIQRVKDLKVVVAYGKRTNLLRAESGSLRLGYLYIR